MHVIFDRSPETVPNATLVAVFYWTVAVLSSSARHTACSRLVLAQRCLQNVR